MGGEIAPRTAAVTGSAHRGTPLVERGLGAGEGRGKKGIGPSAAPPLPRPAAPLTPSRPASLPPPGGKRLEGSRLTTGQGGKPRWTPVGFSPFLREAAKEL